MNIADFQLFTHPAIDHRQTAAHDLGCGDSRSQATLHSMTALTRYLDDIVEPTFDDFRRKPHSLRHAYIACLVTYHSIDRVTYPKNPGNLRKRWKQGSVEFAIVDMIAHKMKHVVSDDEKHRPATGIPLSSLVFGFGTLNTAPSNVHGVDQGGIDLHNLYFVIRDAIAFLRKQADAT